MIDAKGYRLNVGIILVNNQGRLFWGKRVGKQDAWQFPQGGIQAQESPLQAMYRELHEELGLFAKDVSILAVSKKWLSYRLPKPLVRHDSKPICIGQRQKWFLLELIGEDSAIRFDLGEVPEFDNWHWVEYWHPLQQVIAFKRNVYRQALTEFEPILKAKISNKNNLS